MRYLLGVLIAILFWTGPSAAQTETARERFGLVGPVRTIRLETTHVSNDGNQTVEGPRVLLQTASFDENGSATEQTVFNPDGALKFKYGWSTSYDTKGREAERIFLNANGARTGRSVSRYDDKGRRIEITFFNPDGQINHTELLMYDAAGRVVQKTHRNPDETIRNKHTYLYDSKGRRSEWSIYAVGGVLYQRDVSTYDDKGREIGLTVYRGDGTVAMSETRIYDDQGILREGLRYRDGVLVSRETFSYEFDARGNWIKRQIARETLQRGGASQRETEINYRTIIYW